MDEHRTAGAGATWAERLETWLGVPGGATTVEWEPVHEEGLRVTRVVERPAGDLERMLHVRPEELIRLAYGQEAVGTPVRVRLQLSPRFDWLRVPVRVESRTPSAVHTGAEIAIHWAADVLTGVFPEMDADLLVRPAGEGSATLVLEGHYRPRLGLAGLLADRLVGRFVAAATAQQFLERLAGVLEARGA